MTTSAGGLEVRAAGLDDADAVTDTITQAFDADPTWTWAFPDPALRPAQYTRLWSFMVGGALRFPWVFVTPGCAAAAVWIPPGESEVTDAQAATVEPMLRELVGDRTPEVLELFELFEEARPVDRPHYYLTLLGVRPDHAGRGLGMALLAENLARIDALGMPAYLESSNPANNRRYERHGFEAIGSFNPPGSPIPVTTMWREARS